MTNLSSSFIEWSGPDGEVTIQSYGSQSIAVGQLLPHAPQMTLSQATSNFGTAQAYARDYFVTMGVPACQIIGGSKSHDILLQRVVYGIPVVDSIATAIFDIDYQTTSEQLYWPSIPEDVVMAAQAFQSTIASPSALAALKRKLPSYAQGPGEVVIHHSSPAGLTMGGFEAVTTYDVTSTRGTNGYLSFSSSGLLVDLPQ